MSKEFGLDWPRYEYSRMEAFRAIMLAEMERDQKELQKLNNRASHGR